MSRNAQENTWVRKSRLLTQMLILSGTLNIGLFATFVYFVLRESQEPVALELKPVENSGKSTELTNEKVLRHYATLSFQDLLLRLENKVFVEDGYMQRDLALACLVAFHHFNLERALGGLSLQQRKVIFTDEEGEQGILLSIFPGVADYQYQAILRYARMEKWPLTSQGLFFALKRREDKVDATLREAFSLTPEFYSVFNLFNRSGMRLSKEVIIALVAEGEWEVLSRFAEEQRIEQNLSPERRRAFLLEYMESGSKIALHLLFRTDIEFISKRFSDAQVLDLLEVLDEKTIGLEDFLRDLLVSPRSDAVLEKSGRKLYGITGQMPPEPYEHAQALQRFIPQAVIVQEPVIFAAPIERPKEKQFHIVEEGDSLWKIARRYHTSIDALMHCNQLDSPRLRVGKKLEIPQPTN